MNLSTLFPSDFVELAGLKTREAVESGVGISAAVLATIDGFAVAHALTDAKDAARIAALASSISSIGSVATQEAGLGRCTNVILNTDQGFAVVRQFQHSQQELVLIAVADHSALLAQVMYKANEYVKALGAA